MLFIALTPAIAGGLAITIIEPTDHLKIEKVGIESEDNQQISSTPTTSTRVAAGLTGFYIAKPDDFYAIQGTITSQTEIIFDNNVDIAIKTKIVQGIAINPPAKTKIHTNLNQQHIAGGNKQKKTLNTRSETKITSVPFNSPFGGTILSYSNKIAVTTNTSPTTKTNIKKLGIGISVYTTIVHYNTTLKKASNGTTFANHIICFDISYHYISRPPPAC